MFPDSIFIDQQDNDSLRRNQTIKNTALKLIEGDTLTQQCSVIHSVVNHLLDVASQEDPLRAAVYFCSRLTDPLVASLTGLREITTAPAAHAFGNLVRVGTDLGVCVCPARDNLALVEDTLRRKAMLDEWAPIVSRGEAGDDVCSMCLEALASLGDDQASYVCTLEIIGKTLTFWCSCASADAQVPTFFIRSASKIGLSSSSTTTVPFAVTIVHFPTPNKATVSSRFSNNSVIYLLYIYIFIYLHIYIFTYLHIYILIYIQHAKATSSPACSNPLP